MEPALTFAGFEGWLLVSSIIFIAIARSEESYAAVTIGTIVAAVVACTAWIAWLSKAGPNMMFLLGGHFSALPAAAPTAVDAYRKVALIELCFYLAVFGVSAVASRKWTCWFAMPAAFALWFFSISLSGLAAPITKTLEVTTRLQNAYFAINWVLFSMLLAVSIGIVRSLTRKHLAPASA